MSSLQRRRAIIEALEDRRLLAGDPLAGFPLPFQLDFNRPKQGLLDRDGSGTGFTYAVPNAAGDEYNPGAIDLRMGAGILRIYSSGNASTGGMFDSDNTLRNVLTTNFGASSKPWVMYTRLNGPPTIIDQAHEQAGLFFGPDQDNYVKLVLAAEGGQVGLQFVDEQKFKTGYRHYLPQTVYNIGSFANIGTIDLYLSGDPAARTVRGLYRINEGPIKELNNKLVLDPEKAGAFFAFAPHAGLMVQHKNNGTGISMTVEQFGIKRGVLVGEVEPTTSGKISTGSRRVFNDVRGGTGGQQIGVSVRNDGNGPLTISGLNVTGADASMFSASIVGGSPQTIQPGQSASLKLTFTAPSSTALGIKTANLAISSNDATTPVKNVALRGLATAGTGGTNEPSLQRLMELFQIPINVGDTAPDDVFLDDPPAQPNDEVAIPQFRKAGSGDVTIQPISVFGVSSAPALRFGTYEPGSPSKTTELFTIDTADAQTVNPVPVGASSFDPGSAAFSLYTVWPGFKNADNSIRITYQEDQFNAFDAGDKRHIRFYPFKNSDGSVLANTYILAVEEIDAAKDNQDIVAIISNVVSAAAGAEIGTENLDGWPAPDRLVFNKFQVGDPGFPNTASHTQAKVRVRNAGSATLSISSIVASGPFSVLSSTGAQNIQPGKFSDVLVQFNGSSTTGFKSGTVTINSNDADEPVKIINLSGYHQRKPEGGFEPTLSGVINTLFGFGTVIVGAGQNINTGGKRTAVGDEVLSNYWRRANTSLPVTVKQISSLHTQGTTAVFNWFTEGTTALKKLFTEAAVDAQSLYPRQEGNLGAYAEGSFTPSGSTAFGFKVDNESSDDTKNVQEQPGGGWGHHVRFYPLKNAEGAVVADSYLMVMDYNGINYDYNDNVYIITNIKPA